ncbi:MAG: AAA family ATPase [Verrucomicrobia bacterium]|nr:AAA family ATPase [Verrucomicrobiota bacterium]
MKAASDWAAEIAELYQSHSTNQFVLYGNIDDQFVFADGPEPTLGMLSDFLIRTLMGRFDVVLTYDLGNGIRIDKGQPLFAQWPSFKDYGELPKAPRLAMEMLTHYFRYCANLKNLGKNTHQIGCIVKAAHLVAPAAQTGVNYDLNALALLMRNWSMEQSLLDYPLATCLLAENLNDLHPILSHNPKAAAIKIPLPAPDNFSRALALYAPRFPTALKAFETDRARLAGQLCGLTLSTALGMLKLKEYRKETVKAEDLADIKKELVEKECNALIEFVEPKRSLADYQGHEKLKQWLQQDIRLWQQNEIRAMPMGYLICGPVGTGKTFLVECIAGEAGVPVVKIKNFRDKWVGSTEGNLEKIFRLLHALGRCYVFIDEADQALGRRDSGSNDAGLSGRIYSMMAKEMSDPANRGKIVWILATSRPDLVEIDLKRPGRVDVKIPILPTTTPQEGFDLIRALCCRNGVPVAPADFEPLKSLIPNFLTPGAVDVIALKAYRHAKTQPMPVTDVLREILREYRPPVPMEDMEFQIRIALNETSDWDFVPEAFKQHQPKTQDKK